MTLEPEEQVTPNRALSAIVLGYLAGTLGLITMIIFAMLMSAVDGWAITFKFNLLGEAIVELFFLLGFLITGVVSFWKIAQSLLIYNKK